MSKYIEIFALGVEILSEAAQSLGRAGERLVSALARFHKCLPESPVYPTLFKAAGDACWAYVLQRELLGLYDQEVIKASYQVPPQVWNAMGRLDKEKN